MNRHAKKIRRASIIGWVIGLAVAAAGAAALRIQRARQGAED